MNVDKEIADLEKQLDILKAVRDRKLPRILIARNEINLRLHDALTTAMEHYYSNDFHEENDCSNQIYKAAMQMAYGDKIFDKLNKEVFV